MSWISGSTSPKLGRWDGSVLRQRRSSATRRSGHSAGEGKWKGKAPACRGRR
jgi:hypothetical protein